VDPVDFMRTNKCTWSHCGNVRSAREESDLCDACISREWEQRAKIANRIVAAFGRIGTIKQSATGPQNRPWLTRFEFDSFSQKQVNNTPAFAFFAHNRYTMISIHGIRCGLNGAQQHWRYDLRLNNEAAMQMFRFAAEELFPQIENQWEAS
jgi:Cys-tRNA synthase (O-phospho-L-seryl-tRNA:Cys-tRNA synthase)